MCFKATPEHPILAEAYMRVEFGLYSVHLKFLFAEQGKKASQVEAAICRRVKLILQPAGQKDPSPFGNNIRAVSVNLHTIKRKLRN